MKSGDVSVSYVQTVKEAILGAGKDPTPLMKQFGISEALLNNPHARINISRLMYIGRGAIQLTHKPWFGLLIARQLTPGSLGLQGWAAMTAPALSEVLSVLIGFEALQSRNIRGHSRYYSDSDSGSPVCHYYSLVPYNHYNYFCVDFALAHWYVFVQLITGCERPAKRVEIEYEDIGFKDYFEDFFQCPVHFGAEKNALILLPQLAQQPSLFAHSTNHRHALELAERERMALSSESGFRNQVVAVITPLLAGHSATIENVAGELGMTSWTLRRKLRKENTVFQRLLDETRRDLALNYVSDSIFSFSEIAYILGFSTPASFHRAFKRWVQVNPGQYRKLRAGKSRF